MTAISRKSTTEHAISSIARSRYRAPDDASATEVQLARPPVSSVFNREQAELIRKETSDARSWLDGYDCGRRMCGLCSLEINSRSRALREAAVHVIPQWSELPEDAECS